MVLWSWWASDLNDVTAGEDLELFTLEPLVTSSNFHGAADNVFKAISVVIEGTEVCTTVIITECGSDPGEEGAGVFAFVFTWEEFQEIHAHHLVCRLESVPWGWVSTGWKGFDTDFVLPFKWGLSNRLPYRTDAQTVGMSSYLQ